MATKQIYCAQCRLDQPHNCSLDKNKEIVAECSVCKRTIKFPLVPKEQLDELIAKHAESSKGQISVEMAAEEQAVHDAEFLKSLGITG